MAQPTWIGYKLSDRYEIEQELGSGGMSAVFKASDPNLKRVVAIKLIHPHLSNNPDFIHRFEVEASAVAQLRHPNIVQVYDFNHDGDTYYMVLEFVPGESLQQRLKRMNAAGRRMTTDEVIDLAAKICDAVDYAHKRGLVHRDIKPANVMINVQGEPILMDFGIVKILGGTQHTATGAVVGTALYMSPEQIRGEHPDHRADIYSLGVMLYEMVSGRPPYEADSAMTIMMMHLNDPVPDVTATAGGLPVGFKLVLERALAKNPAQRFQSAGEMAAAIRAIRTGGAAALTQPPAGTVVETPRTFVEAPRAPAPAPQATYIEPQQSAARQPAQSFATQQAPPPQPPAAQARPAAASKKPNSRALLFGGAAIVVLLLLCIIGAVAFLPGLLENLNAGGRPTDQVTSTQEQQAVLTDATATPEPTLAATNTPEPPTATPTDTPTPTITPTPTATQPEGPYVLITDITVVSGAYNVFYETFNFDPAISNNPETHHIHFFWNTYDPVTVGINGVGDSTGGGSWILYDVPSPFKGYTVGARPGAATQICALVANYDHSINLDTGNCFDLPE